MATTLDKEVRKILAIAGVSAMEIDVVSCNPGDPARLDDDTCVLETSSYDSGSSRKNVRVDDVFTLVNAWNTGLKNPPELDHRNYFFRLDPNAVFYKRGSASNIGDGGLLYRSAGTMEWRAVDFKEIQASPQLRAAIVPILMGALQSSDAHVQAKAVLWLTNLVPTGDRALREALGQSLPVLKGDAVFLATLRLKEEGEGAVRSVVPSLVKIKERGASPIERESADAALASAAPYLSPEDRSSRIVVRPFFNWGLSSSVYIPWNGAPVGGYSAANAGAQFCIDRAFVCAQREGFRLGISGEVGRMINGYGSVFFGGRIFAGNEYVTGFIDGGVHWYPTGGFSGDLTKTPALGVGVKAVFVPSFPLGLKAGVRMNPTNDMEGAAYVGLEIGQ